MKHTADTLTPNDFLTYRLARFGEAGRDAEKGPKLAGAHHGVTKRAWLYYESGNRRPATPVRRLIAAWLNRQEKVQPAIDGPNPNALPPE